MEIKFSQALSSATRWGVDDLKPGQCFIVAGQVFTRVDAGPDYRLHHGGRAVSAVALDGTDFYLDRAELTGEVYEIESITLRRVK